MKKAKHMNEQPMTVEQKKKARVRKNTIGLSIFLVLLALVVAVLLLLPKMVNQQPEEKTNIMSFEAAPATISTRILAAGMLIDEEANAITIPYGVELEYAVKNGDYVQAGDLIASVDETSVMLTIAEIQAAMEEIDEKIAEAMDGDAVTTVTAPAEARVKEIYAAEGDSVAEVMYEHGSLMRLSLDGKMAVDIDAALVSAGQAVDVTLPDGTVKSGRVAAVTGNVATVTITDNGPDVGEIVTVEDSDGNYLGGGELYIHSELKITGYYGETEEIFVEEEELVEIEEELISFTAADSSAAYAALLSERNELEEQMKKLFTVYQRGGVYAEEQGYVTELGSSATQENSQQQQSDMFGGYAPMSSMTETYTALDEILSAAENGVLLNSGEGSEVTETPVTTGTPEVTEMPEATETPETAETPTPVQTPVSGEDDNTSGEPEDDTSGGDSDNEAEVGDGSGDANDEPEDGDDSGDASDEPENGDDSGDASDEPEDGEDSGDASEEPEETAAGFRDVYAVVESSADGAMQLLLSGTKDYVHYGDSVALNALEYTEKKTLFYTDPAADSEAPQTTVFFYVNNTWSMGTMSQITAGAHLVLTYADTGNGETLMWIVCHQSALNGGTTGETDSSASGEMSTTVTTQTTGTMPNTGLTQQQQQSYTLSEITVCSITPDTDMTVEIAIDELDVLDVYEGQSVQLYLTALDETVTGVITELAEEATSNGGSAKFAAIVTIDRTADMRSGMNAAVTLDLAQTDASCCVPAEALVEMGSKTCVYTVYDEKKEELTGLVEVTTGLSDGDMVEITAGLAQGITVWYEYVETDSQIFF